MWHWALIQSLNYINILPAFKGECLPLDLLFKNSCTDRHQQLQGEIINFKVRSMNHCIDLQMIAAWEELFPPERFTWLHHILCFFQMHSEVSQALHVRTLQHKRSREGLIPAFAVQPTINILNSAVPKCEKGRDYEIEINGHASYTTWCFTFSRALIIECSTEWADVHLLLYATFSALLPSVFLYLLHSILGESRWISAGRWCGHYVSFLLHASCVPGE